MLKQWFSVFIAILLVQLDTSYRLLQSTYSFPQGSTRLFGILEDVGLSMDKIAAANAERLARKEGEEILGYKTGGVKVLTRCSIPTMESKPSAVAKLLVRDGCLSIPSVLSSSTIDSLLPYISTELDYYKQEVENGNLAHDDYFGGINCRGSPGIFGKRQDFWLPVSSPVVRSALKEAFQSLQPLLQETVTLDGVVHEVSCLIAEPGAPRQNIHADTIVLPCPQYPDASMEPMYTFFIAMQDLDDEMGQTIFCPKTHTPEIHLLWNSNQRQKEMLLGTRDVVQSGLKKGDVSIFDSRILHCGSANNSNKRRVLFYFTLSKQERWPLPNGLHGSNSIRSEDRYKWKVRDILG